MRIKITAPNVWNEEGRRYSVGQIIDLGDVEALPKRFTNKAEILDDSRAFVVNPGEADEVNTADIDPDRLAAYNYAVAKLEELDPVGNFMADGRPKVSALNDNLPDATAPFDADERTTMWAITNAEAE
jgi:hypothetical protein